MLALGEPYTQTVMKAVSGIDEITIVVVLVRRHLRSEPPRRIIRGIRSFDQISQFRTGSSIKPRSMQLRLSKACRQRGWGRLAAMLSGKEDNTLNHQVVRFNVTP